MSGWFADPEASKPFVLGPCRCPGTPHEEDYIDLRCDLAAPQVGQLEVAADGIDRLKFLILGWNMVDADAQPIPVDRDHIERMYLDIFRRINPWITKNVRTGSVPNGSSAPSRHGSRASASQIRTIPKSA